MRYLSSEVPQRLIKDGCSMPMAESHTPIVNACLQAPDLPQVVVILEF